jgi:hypothetical protein
MKKIDKHKALNKLPVFTENYASILEAFCDVVNCGEVAHYKVKDRRYLQVQLLEAADGHKVLVLSDHDWIPDPVDETLNATPDSNAGQLVEVLAIHCTKFKGKWRLLEFSDSFGIYDVRLYDWATRRCTQRAVAVSDAYHWAQKFLRHVCAPVKPS